MHHTTCMRKSIGSSSATAFWMNQVCTWCNCPGVWIPYIRPPHLVLQPHLHSSHLRNLPAQFSSQAPALSNESVIYHQYGPIQPSDQLWKYRFSPPVTKLKWGYSDSYRLIADRKHCRDVQRRDVWMVTVSGSWRLTWTLSHPSSANCLHC